MGVRIRESSAQLEVSSVSKMPRVLPSEETKEEQATRSPMTPPNASVAGTTPGGSKRPRTAEEKAIAARLGESRAGW